MTDDPTGAPEPDRRAVLILDGCGLRIEPADSADSDHDAAADLPWGDDDPNPPVPTGDADEVPVTRVVWILTRSYNDYDQHGEYFVAVFFAFPSQDELVHAGVPLGDAAYVQGGGGQRHGDYDWFELTRHQEPT